MDLKIWSTLDILLIIVQISLITENIYKLIFMKGKKPLFIVVFI